MNMTIKPIALLLALCACVSSASAANISYTGEFTYDNDVKLFQFTVDTLSTVGLRTWSYAGGINAAGETIARGGFDPIVALFDAAGQLVAEQDDGGCRKVAADALTRQCWDINLSIELAPGTYTASLQQYNNYHVSGNLADGFYYQDAQYRNFRNGFVDEMDVKRNASWAFDLLNVSLPAPADVPEPGSIWLVGAALAGLAALRRRKAGASNE
ncbi:MAG: DVUA0089 family protein [Janthinobacterium lividum]